MSARKIPLFQMSWTEQDVQAVNAVLRRGTSWAAGPEIEEFEQALASFHGKKYAVTFNSGTSALQGMYQAVGVEGKEVIVPSFTFIATANAALLAGGIPVFAEAEAETFGLDANDVEKRITPNTKAIVALHYAGGICRDIEKLQQLAEKHKLTLLEDNAHSLGAKKNGRLCGTFGSAAALSFCQNKLITTGEGGAVITDSSEIYEKLKLLRSHGRVDPVAGDYFSSTAESEYIFPGYNLRMPTMNAALGLSQLRHFTETIKQRVQHAGDIISGLKGFPGLQMPLPYPHSDHLYQMFTISLPTRAVRDALQAHLARKGIMCKVYYSPIHLSTLYRKKCGYKEGDLPVTEQIAERILTLPIYPMMSEEEKKYIVAVVREFIESGGILP